MKPTETLKEEHQLILVMLKIVDTVCEKLDQGETVDAGHLAYIIDFIRNFADGCHHAKEEKLLFVALEKAGMPQNDGPVAVMLREHVLGRSYVKGMDDALQLMKAGDNKAVKLFTENARAYVRLLSAHIDKEDHVLFAMADERLSKASQKDLMEGFDRLERDETGVGVHEKYHALLDKLRNIYL
jgi:hemerythrin-like domain-containing protein